MSFHEGFGLVIECYLVSNVCCLLLLALLDFGRLMTLTLALQDSKKSEAITFWLNFSLSTISFCLSMLIDTVDNELMPP